MAKKKKDVPVASVIMTEQPSKFLSTGSSLLNFAISEKEEGGIAVGRTTQIMGDESTGKSLLAAEIAGAIQREGGEVVYCDVEGTLDLKRSHALCGMSLEEGDFRVDHPFIIEDLWDRVMAGLIELCEKDKRPRLVIIDSLSAMKCRREEESDDTEKNANFTSAFRAKVFGAGYRKYQEAIVRNNITLLFVSQVRANPNQTMGDNRVSDCGKAIKFYASTIVKLKVGKKLKDGNDVVQGVNVKFVVSKNKIAPPMREGEFAMYFDYGIDDIESLLRFNKKYSSDTTFEGHRSVEDAISEVEDNPEKFTALMDRAYKIWMKLHEYKYRKPRHTVLAEAREANANSD
jgi:recombination protein RecA